MSGATTATFPAEKAAVTTKYAHELANYAKLTDVPGLERAKSWLEAFDKVVARE